ncbi:MAG TPA: hypothetical protein GX708_22415 [Gallicola sp.]|nr:hypothetical protein [Gallicola sp.]
MSNHNKTVFVDTNILMSNPEKLFDTYDRIIICGVVLQELDKHKYSSDENKKYQARLATRLIEQNEDKIQYEIREGSASLPSYLDSSSNDNKILSILLDLRVSDDSIVALSNDLNFRQKCKLLKIPCEKFNCDISETGYKGYLELNLNSEEINQLYEDLSNGINNFNLIENQYVIIHEKGKKKPLEFRYSKNKLEDLKLPDSKVIKGKNSQQRCAIDLLNNKNIPIKIVAGTYGSGKSYITTKMGLYHTFEKGNYGKMLLLRNPLGSGEEIGFLPGNKEDKIGDFFKCIEQYIDTPSTKDKNINEYITKDIPFYIKGMSYGSTFVFVEESEDMDLKILKLIGSRIESDSCVVFCGDYKQSEQKYRRNNGLFQLIEKLKGNPLVGIIVLNEDVRSEASKVFVDI